MRIGTVINSAGLILTGAAFLIRGTLIALEHKSYESPITLIKTGAILFPLTLLIWKATEKIFDDLGWQPSEARCWTGYLVTVLISTALASAAAVGFKFTKFLRTGWLVTGIALEIISGAILIYSGVAQLSEKKINH